MMKGLHKAIDISFAGAGFLGVYQIGVARFLQDDSVLLNCVGGCSSGSMVSCMLLDQYPAKQMREKFQVISRVARKSKLGAFGPQFDVGKILKEYMLPELSDDVLSKVNNRLYISLTKLNRTNLVVSEYDTKEDLIDALTCSSFIPAYSGYRIPKFKGVRYLDGGITDNLPKPSDNTICVSSFSGKGKHISPYDEKMGKYPSFKLGGEDVSLSPFNIKRLMDAGFINSDRMYDLYEEQGYRDAETYFQSKSR